MKPVYSRFPRVAPKNLRDKTPAPMKTYGLPKGEFTRRLAGVGVSYRDDEATIETALKIVEAFLGDVRRRRCANCGGRQMVEAHHVGSRGARHVDFGNTAPACWSCHQREHGGETLNVDMAAVARAVGVEYLAAHSVAANFIASHSMNAEVLALLPRTA